MYFKWPKGFLDLSSYEGEKGWLKSPPHPWTHCIRPFSPLKIIFFDMLLLSQSIASEHDRAIHAVLQVFLPQHSPLSHS